MCRYADQAVKLQAFDEFEPVQVLPTSLTLDEVLMTNLNCYLAFGMHLVNNIRCNIRFFVEKSY